MDIMWHVTEFLWDMLDEHGEYRLYDSEGISLAERVSDTLQGIKDAGEILEFSVISDEASDGPAGADGVVSFAWIDQHLALGHESFVWHE